jgi:hypothetical protein
MTVNYLKMECAKCRVATFCPERGSSPLKSPTTMTYCQIVGGYGRDPVESSILSPESLEARDKNGPCLTLAYVPFYDKETEQISAKLTKIFSPPVLHERETVSWDIEAMIPKSHS